MDGLDVSALIAGGGPWAIVAIGVIGILRGDIVSRRTHENRIADRDQIIVDVAKDRDYYRTKYEEQSAQLLDVFADRATQAVLRAGVMNRIPGADR